MEAGAMNETTKPDRRKNDARLISIEDLSVSYSGSPVFEDVNLDIPGRSITALIGPSGSGKSTFLRCLNRMNDLVEPCRVTGKIEIDGSDIYSRDVDPVDLRSRVGMVFQVPNPFPKSIFFNVAYGLRIHGLAQSRTELEDRVRSNLERVGLWNEVADRLHHPGTSLSNGQQQRLVIARALAVGPEILLMDEPCSALDPIATARIEELIDELREDYCIVIVTHSLAQAARVSQRTAFLKDAALVEFGKTEDIFTNPVDPRTRDYVTGRFG